MPYKDPEKRKAAFKKYYEKNKDKVLEKNRKWWEDNRERAKEINTASHKKLRGDVPIIKDHEDIGEALDNLLSEPEPEPKPEPVPEPEPEPLTEEEVAEILKDFKR